MKNYKILETNYNLPDVLLYRDRNSDGQEMVIIFAIGESTLEANNDYFISEVVKFDTVQMAQSFIYHFNSEQATDWAKFHNVMYA